MEAKEEPKPTIQLSEQDVEQVVKSVENDVKEIPDFPGMIYVSLGASLYAIMNLDCGSAYSWFIANAIMIAMNYVPYGGLYKTTALFFTQTTLISLIPFKYYHGVGNARMLFTLCVCIKMFRTGLLVFGLLKIKNSFLKHFSSLGMKYVEKNIKQT